MAVLCFRGNQSALFAASDDRSSPQGDTTVFSNVTAPFLPTDMVEIEVPDRFIRSDGEFSFDEVQFTRVTIIRGGVRYEAIVDSGSKIKETGGNSIKEQGDTFFITNDEVELPNGSPFAGLKGKLVFASNATFQTGDRTTILREVDLDLDGDGQIGGPGERGNSNFNVRQDTKLPCFAAGTLIETNSGLKQVQAIEPGDLVQTLDHGVQRVLWVRAGAQPLEACPPEEMPVLIGAGALGAGRPSHDLIVSPQHRILVGACGQLEEYFSEPVFVPAKALTNLPHIRLMKGKKHIVWVHFCCEAHEIVQANGCFSETLLLGPMVIESLSAKDRADVGAIYGYPAHPALALNGAPARPCLTVGQTHRQLEKKRARRDGISVHGKHPATDAQRPARGRAPVVLQKS